MASKRDCSDATAEGLRNTVTSEQKINVLNNPISLKGIAVNLPSQLLNEVKWPTGLVSKKAHSTVENY
jgi:hypothetical protein